MDNLSETMSSVWREVSREARTSLGRCRSSASASNRPIVKPPPGAHGLTTHEDEGGWDVVERTSTERKEVRETHTALPARAIIFYDPYSIIWPSVGVQIALVDDLQCAGGWRCFQ